MRRPSPRWLAVFLVGAVFASACACDPIELVEVPEAPDEELPDPLDAGIPKLPRPDAGPPRDAGQPLPEDTAYVPCGTTPQERDAGPEATYFELCVGLHRLTGTASLNDQITTEPIRLRFQSNFGSSVGDAVPDFNGAYELDVLRGRYDSLQYQPNAIFPTHQGFLPLGQVDLRTDAIRDLSAKSWTLSGAALLDGAPWSAGTLGPELQLAVLGVPPVQSASTSAASGEYLMRFLEAQAVTRVSLSREVLGNVEIKNHSFQGLLILNQDTRRDLELTTSKLTLSLTQDGAPLPDRLIGDDYELSFTPAGENTATVYAYSDVAAGDAFSGRIPRGNYGISLFLPPTLDDRYPSYIQGLQLAPSVDLTTDRILTYDLSTVTLEVGLSVDGNPVSATPSARWQLYAYAYNNPGKLPWTSMFDVALDSSGFFLQAIPSRSYYFLVYLTASLHPQFPTGWWVYDLNRHVIEDTSLPIDIQTQAVEGQLRVDGVPSAGIGATGTLLFSGDKGSFRLPLADSSGVFRTRLPYGTYRISFAPDAAHYPQLARGSYELIRNVAVTEDTPLYLPLDLRTRRVTGPFRVNGEALPDSLPQDPEATLTLQRRGDNAIFKVPLGDELAELDFRIQQGTYALTFELAAGALPKTASGSSQLGYDLIVPEPPPLAIEPGSPP